jgi:hypothetical protein
MKTTSDINDNDYDAGWPENLPGYTIENPIVDLLYVEIDYSNNILGNLWLERQSYAVVQGPSGIGKSMFGFQAAVEASLGKPVFGLAVAKPLKVLLLQAEDSLNDRIRQAACIKRLAPSRAEARLAGLNFRIFTPHKRASRGEELFEFLGEAFKDFNFDLLILNPAFAFIDGNVNDSTAVGDFLRSQLQEFLRVKDAAAIVIHHVPKPPKSGKGRDSNTTMYSGHGSAEWANAPRGSMTINRTRVPWVFQFDIGKRGSFSGWTPDREGYYIRYFTHTRQGDMFWAEASEEDIGAAETGFSTDDFDSVFSSDSDYTFDDIKRRFRHFGYNYSDQDLGDILAEAVERGKLVKTKKAEGEQVWHPIKAAKTSPRDVKREAEYEARVEIVYLAISEAGPAGINVNGLRLKGFAFGSSTLDECLKRLAAAGRIEKRPDGRWVVVVRALDDPAVKN